jgi:hypothetical protein
MNNSKKISQILKKSKMEFSHFEKEIIDIVLKFCKDKAVIEELLQLVLNYADQKESKKL